MRSTLEGQALELTVLMPCLNEAETIEACIRKAQAFLHGHGVRGEVLIADNGSTDGSQQLAVKQGARVVPIPERGYGAALLGGTRAALGKFVIMGDADDSYDFLNLGPFVEALRSGAQLVVGNRFLGGIEHGAMPLLHRYLGNPVLSFLGRLFFRVPLGDFHCGLRGYDRESILRLGLRTPGMEFASEMIVKARLHGLRIAEVPTRLYPDGRSRPPHLRTWRDGWRHLRFLLLLSPRWLFLYPGLVLGALGIALAAWVLPATRVVWGSIGLDVHTLLLASAMLMLGVQLGYFSIVARTHAARIGLMPASPSLRRWLAYSSIEAGVLFGALLAALGVGLVFYGLGAWRQTGFGALDPRATMRVLIPAVTLLVVGAQVAFGAFVLDLMRQDRPVPGSETDTGTAAE